MAFTTSVQQTAPGTANTNIGIANDISALLSMVIMSVYAINKSKREMRKLKRKFLWTAFKLKAKSFFSMKKAISDQTLIYILIGIAIIALIILAPIAALIVAILALILILAKVI